MVGAQRCGPLLEIRYRAWPGVHTELEELVAAEARQCPYLTWTLDQGNEGQLLVRIEASTEHPDDVAAIALLVDAQLAAASSGEDPPAPVVDQVLSAWGTGGPFNGP